jgi:hypothetical protein
MTALNFPTLKAYTTWRATMRETYITLSQDIRKLKLDIKTKQKAHGSSAAADEQSKLVTERGKARTIMEQRVEAKQIARDSWETWRAAISLAA